MHLDFQNYQNEKKSMAELVHNDIHPVYKPYFAYMPIPHEMLNRI